MNNFIYNRLLEIIAEEKEAFDTLISADNVLGLNVSSDDLIDFLEFETSEKILKAPIIGNVIITEGDILSVLRVIHDIIYYEGEYILYINNDNVGTITYLINRANKIYQEANINIKIKIDYSDNYNAYLNSLVTILGSENFVKTSETDFKNPNKIII